MAFAAPLFAAGGIGAAASGAFTAATAGIGLGTALTTGATLLTAGSTLSARNKAGKASKSLSLEQDRLQKVRAERNVRRRKLSGTLGGSLLTGGRGVTGNAPTERKTLLGE